MNLRISQAQATRSISGRGRVTHFALELPGFKSRSHRRLGMGRALEPIELRFDDVRLGRVEKIDLADGAKRFLKFLHLIRECFVAPRGARRGQFPCRLTERRVIAVSRRVEKPDDPGIGKSLDLLSANQRRIASVVGHLFGEPLKQFVLGRCVRQQVGRSLDLDRARFLEFSPDRYARRFMRRGEAEEQEKPGAIGIGKMFFHQG